MEMFDIRPTGFPMAKDLTTEATIATALTAIAQVSLLHRAALTVSLGVKNTGAVNALDQFVIQAQYRQDGDWLTFLSDTDWQKKVWSVTDTVANLQDLPAGADGACAFSVEGVRAIRILAATVASTTTVTVGITVSEGGGVGNLTPSNQADVDIGDVHLLNAADAQIDPATLQATLGTGAPVPLAFADPGTDAYTAALSPGRACTRLRVIVGNSGVVISLDNGTTQSIKLPPNSMDEVGLLPTVLAAAADIKVKRYTVGVAMTDLLVEVR